MNALEWTAGCLTRSTGALSNLTLGSGRAVRLRRDSESRLVLYVRRTVVQIGVRKALQATARVVAVNKAPRARREANLAECYEIEGEIMRTKPRV
jgi:hypothetical protein